MSRNIVIGYELLSGGQKTLIEVRPPYYILGTQESSKRFWSRSELRELGLAQLVELGDTDPVNFYGWEAMDELRHEIERLWQHCQGIGFEAELKSQWIAHLIYCFLLLVQTAPKESVPVFSIG